MAKHKSKVQYEHQPVTVDLAWRRRWIKRGRITRVAFKLLVRLLS